MKILKTILLSVLFCLMLFSFSASVYAKESDYRIWLEQARDAIDSDTAKMLDEIGLSDGMLTDGLAALSPEKVFSSFFRMLNTSFKDLAGYFFTVVAVLMAVYMFSSLLGQGKTASVAANTGVLVAVFVIIAANGEIFICCRNAIELSKDMMLALLPIFTGIVAFSGKPQLALSFNAVLFGFAQTVSVTFSGLLPGIAVTGTALGTASAISPVGNYSAICKLIAKAASTVAAFVAGIFAAILSVRGVIAGAADTVALKGLRFIVGNGVPIVGGALSEALGSLLSGFQLIKNSLLSLGIIAIVFVCIPPLLRILVWNFMLCLAAVFADMLSLSKISEMISSVKSVLAVLGAVTVFNSFVYIIACALLLTVK